MSAGSGGGTDRVGRLLVPGEQIGDALGWVVGDPDEDVGEIGLRVEAVELCRLDQLVQHGRCPRTPGVRSGKQIVLAANGDAAQGALRRIVVEAETAIVEAAGQCRPARRRADILLEFVGVMRLHPVTRSSL